MDVDLEADADMDRKIHEIVLKVQEQAYDLFAEEGVALPQIAAHMHVEQPTVADWIMDKLFRLHADEDVPHWGQRARDLLRVLQRQLLRGEPQAGAQSRDAFAETISRAEALIARDGRCGAALRGVADRFCQDAPVRGKRRCTLHGGAGFSAAGSRSR